MHVGPVRFKADGDNQLGDDEDTPLAENAERQKTRGSYFILVLYLLACKVGEMTSHFRGAPSYLADDRSNSTEHCRVAKVTHRPFSYLNTCACILLETHEYSMMVTK